MLSTYKLPGPITVCIGNNRSDSFRLMLLKSVSLSHPLIISLPLLCLFPFFFITLSFWLLSPPGGVYSSQDSPPLLTLTPASPTVPHSCCCTLPALLPRCCLLILSHQHPASFSVFFCSHCTANYIILYICYVENEWILLLAWAPSCDSFVVRQKCLDIDRGLLLVPHFKRGTLKKVLHCPKTTFFSMQLKKNYS